MHFLVVFLTFAICILFAEIFLYVSRSFATRSFAPRAKGSSLSLPLKTSSPTWTSCESGRSARCNGWTRSWPE